jgi:hypothetical protein
MLKKPRRRFRRREIALWLRIAIVVCFATGITALMAVKVSRWASQIDELPDPRDRINAQNEVARTLIQLAGGALVIAGLYFTSRTIYVSQQGQITDRFNKAIDHLGSESIPMRLGGIYAIARIAADSKRDASTIVEILASFLRGAAVNCEGDSSPVDVQAVLKILGSAPWVSDTIVDLTGCMFCGIMAPNLDLSDSILNSTTFRKCHLDGARFDGSSAVASDFSLSYMRGCSFRNCDVTVAKFEQTRLRESDFVNTKLFGAKFAAASLLHADFSDATGALRQEFEQAIFDETTILPPFLSIDSNSP